jgi:hypothetical protein
MARGPTLTERRSSGAPVDSYALFRNNVKYRATFPTSRTGFRISRWFGWDPDVEGW